MVEVEQGVEFFLSDTFDRNEIVDLLKSIPELESAINKLPKISLDEMSGAKLMNRIDIKYIVHQNVIPKLLGKAQGNYFIQEIDGRRVADYGTLYLDTEDLLLYHKHVNGKLNRCKWRIRTYLESNLSFLEIKDKKNTGLTQKKRIVYNPEEGLNNNNSAEFISEMSCLKAQHLYPMLKNHFNRITLVNNDKCERLTIDFNLTFLNCSNEKSTSIDNLCIVEIKQERFGESALRKYLELELRMKKAGISKYCLGIALTDDSVKSNVYKRKIRYINKITNKV